MTYDERQRQDWQASLAFLARTNARHNAPARRPTNDPTATGADRLAMRCAAARSQEARLARLQAALDALCREHRARGTCPGHCVRGEL